MNVWNELVTIKNSDKAKEIEYTRYDGIAYSWSDMAAMNLRELNTASGGELKKMVMKHFVNNYYHVLTYHN